MYRIQGHHHLSMITKNAKENNRFYREILGLRRVKVTVNQDDYLMYHLFYGDKTGSAGTELSFFEMPLAGKTYRGTNAITRIGLLVLREENLFYWQERFEQYGVTNSGITTYTNRPAILFEDFEGLRMAIIASDGKQLNHWETWEHSIVPKKHQIRGIGPVEITVRRPQKIARTLTDLLGYIEIKSTEDERIFQSIEGEPFGEIIIKYLEGPSEKPGRGSIHHLAIRAKDEAELKYWDKNVKERGFHSTGIIDRYYFKSLYFRESNGILFEIATDEPGFTIDGNVEILGEQLDLPPFLEKHRAEIEATLAPIEELS